MAPTFLILTTVIGGWTPSSPAQNEATVIPVAERSWPRWRGPFDTGVAPHADPPITWNERDGKRKNIRWKITVPGKGHSTPIVWGDHVFVTTAIPFGKPVQPERHEAPGAHDNLPLVRRQKFVVLAFHRDDGRKVWERVVHEALPHEGGHVTASFASGSPVTDGEIVVASFGSVGVFALAATDGKVLWRKDLGRLLTKHAHGEGSSPVLHGGTVIINQDHEGSSFVVALDKKTGRQKWRLDRTEVTSWATPIVVEVDGKPQVIISGTKRVRGYDLATGKVVWECGGLAHNVVASPVAADGTVYVASSYEKQSMLAIRLTGARGDLTRSEHLRWVRRRRTPYVPSPLLYRGHLYLLHHYQPTLCRVVAKTGREPARPRRLRSLGNVYASPVAAAGRIYVTDLDGTTVVLAADDATHAKPPLAVNYLDDRISASAAIVGGEMFLRGEKSLYCIARVK